MGDNPAWLPGGPGGDTPPMIDMSKVDPGLQPVLIALLYLCPGIALLILLVRFWKKGKDKMLGGDDVLIGLAWIFTLGNSIIVHLFVKAMYGGYRDEDVPPYVLDFEHIFKLQYALGLEYPPCICLVKASFLWSLYKLRSFNPWIKRTIIALQIINAVFGVVSTVIGAVPCLPIAKVWNKALPGGCYDPLKYVIANISIVLITDFMVLLIPTWIIYDLQMALKRKIVTIAFLSLGFIVIGVGIARLLWLLEAFSGQSKSYSVKSAYSAIELSVAIIGTCGPTIKFILSRFIPFLRPSFERGTTKKSYGSYGNHSSSNNNNTGSRGISQRNTQRNNEYDDLSSISAHEEHIEMKSDWRRDDDARSDEQIMADRSHGIVKSVGWTVQESSVPGTPQILGDSIPRDPVPRATRPNHMV